MSWSETRRYLLEAHQARREGLPVPLTPLAIEQRAWPRMLLSEAAERFTFAYDPGYSGSGEVYIRGLRGPR